MAVGFPKFDARDFVNQRVRREVMAVTLAARSPVFAIRLDWAEEFCGWLAKLLSWVGGCNCHEQEILSGMNVDCPHKGRRLEAAWLNVSNVLRDGFAGLPQQMSSRAAKANGFAVRSQQMSSRAVPS